MIRVYLGIGSNMGNREKNLRTAIEKLGSTPLDVKQVSSFYETEPVGPVLDQPPFLNCIVAGEYDDSAQSLLGLAQVVEEEMGRERTKQKGPRSIDLDILYFGDSVIDDPPRLQVPHPGIPDRRFVLVPMTEVDPDLSHPTLRKSQSELLEATVDSSSVVAWEGEVRE